MQQQDPAEKEFLEMLNKPAQPAGVFEDSFGKLQQSFKRKFGRDFAVTGGADTPMHKKLHAGKGRDIRVKDLSPEEQKFILDEAKRGGFDVRDFSTSWKEYGGSGPHFHVDVAGNNDAEQEFRQMIMQQQEQTPEVAATPAQPTAWNTPQTPDPASVVAEKTGVDAQTAANFLQSPQAKKVLPQLQTAAPAGQALDIDLSGLNAPPTHEQLSQRIYNRLGFSDDEASAYAQEQGTDIANAFYQAPDTQAAARSIFDRRNDRGEVIISGLTPEALREKQLWLARYRSEQEKQGRAGFEQGRLDYFAKLSPEDKQKTVARITADRPLTAEEATALGEQPPGLLERGLADASSSITGAVGSMMEGAKRLQDSPLGAFNPLFELQKQLGLSSPADEIGAIGEDLSRAGKQLRNRRGGQGTADDLIAAAAGTLPLIAGSLATGGSAAVPALMGMAGAAGDAYREAIESGASPEIAQKAAWWAAPVGTLEAALGLGKIGGRIEKEVAESFVKKILLEIGEEAGQEGISKGLNNLIAKGLYDPERGILKDVPYTMFVAGVTGGVLGGGTHAISRAAGKGKKQIEAPEVVMTSKSSNQQGGIQTEAALPNTQPAQTLAQQPADKPSFDLRNYADEDTVRVVGESRAKHHQWLKERVDKHSQEVEDLRAEYKQIQPEWDRNILETGKEVGLTRENGGILLPPSLKGVERTVEKVVGEARDENHVDFKEGAKDIIRASYVVNSLDEFNKVYSAIKKNFTIIPSREKNRFQKPTPVGYSDYLLNVDMGNGKYGEIQIHVPEMLEAKEGPGQGHKFYEVQRTLDTIELRRELTPAERQLRQRMIDEQKEIYGRARNSFTKRANSSLDSWRPSESTLEPGNNLGGSENNTVAMPPDAVGTNETGLSSTSKNSGSSVVDTETGTRSPSMLMASNEEGNVKSGDVIKPPDNSIADKSKKDTEPPDDTPPPAAPQPKKAKPPEASPDDDISFDFGENVKPEAKPTDADDTDLVQFIRSKGGIAMGSDIQGEKKRLRESRLRQPGVFNDGTDKSGVKKGVAHDQMAIDLYEAGYIDEPDVNVMLDALDRAAAGEKIFARTEERQNAAGDEDFDAWMNYDPDTENQIPQSKADQVDASRFYNKAKLAADVSSEAATIMERNIQESVADSGGNPKKVVSFEDVKAEAEEFGPDFVRSLAPGDVEYNNGAVRLAAKKTYASLIQQVADMRAERDGIFDGGQVTQAKIEAAENLDDRIETLEADARKIFEGIYRFRSEAGRLLGQERIKVGLISDRQSLEGLMSAARRKYEAQGGSSKDAKWLETEAAITEQGGKILTTQKELDALEKKLTDLGIDFKKVADENVSLYNQLQEAKKKASSKKVVSIEEKRQQREAKANAYKEKLSAMEAEARKRIADRKSDPPAPMSSQAGSTPIFTQLPADLADYAIIGASKLAQKGIDLATWSKSMIDEFGLTVKQARQVYLESYKLMKQFRSEDAELSQVRAATKGKPEIFSADEIKSLLRERQLLQRRQQNARTELATTFASLQKSTMLETITALRKAGLLTGIKTHMRNVGGNTAYQLFDEAARVPAAITDMAIGAFTKQRTITGANPLAVAKSGYEAATKGVKEAYDIMKNGATEEDLNKLEVTRELNSNSKIINTYVNFVFRSLGASDKVFKTYALRRSLEDRAKSQAISEARQGTIKHSEIGARTRELIKNPPEAMAAEAIADAETSTFNNKSKFADAVQAAKKKLPVWGQFAFDTFVPFVKTPTNIVARMFEASPVGYGKNLLQAGKAIKNRSLTAEDQRAFAQTFGRATTGSALIALGWKLAAMGLMTGIPDDEPSKRERDRAAGRSKMAVRIGDSWHQVGAFSPLGNLLAIGASFHREENQELKDESKRGEKLLSIGTQTVLEQPMLKGANDIIDALKKPGKGSDMAGNLTGSFVPTIVSDAAGAFDSKQRESNSFSEQIQRRIPGLRNKLPEAHDVFGRPVEQRRTSAIDPTLSSTAKEKFEKVDSELVRLDVGVSRLQRKPGESEDDHRERSITGGQQLFKNLTLLVNSTAYNNKSDEDKKEAIAEKIKEVRTKEAKKHKTNQGK